MITVEMSIKDIIWMMENPDKLTEFQLEWITEFKKLILESVDLEKIKNESNQSQRLEDNQ